MRDIFILVNVGYYSNVLVVRLAHALLIFMCPWSLSCSIPKNQGDSFSEPLTIILEWPQKPFAFHGDYPKLPMKLKFINNTDNGFPIGQFDQNQNLYAICWNDTNCHMQITVKTTVRVHVKTLAYEGIHVELPRKFINRNPSWGREFIAPHSSKEYDIDLENYYEDSGRLISGPGRYSVSLEYTYSEEWHEVPGGERQPGAKYSVNSNEVELCVN